jgi:hypothetical protein
MANRIQIKRSIANSVVTGLNTGELAFTANGKVLYIGSPVDGTSIRVAGEQVPGTLTANQALVANATSGIDKVIVANLVPTSIYANGTFGSANQILRSDGSNIYWSTDTGDISEIVAGDGLNGGGTEGVITIDVGAGNGIEVNATSVAVKAGTNGGLISNSSGVFVKAGVGIIVNADGVNVGQDLGVSANVIFNKLDVDILNVTGNTTLGSNTYDIINVNGLLTGNLIPTANVTYYVGNNTNRWAQVFAGNVHATTGTFDGNVSIAGDLVISGNLTTVNVNSVVVSDPILYLAGNNYTSDLVDIGIAANYNDGTNRHTGIFRDHVDGVWKIFTNLTQELSGNNDIDTSDATYRIATLQAYLQSSGLLTNASNISITANSTVSVDIVANTLSLSSPLAATSGGTGYASYTAQDILVASNTTYLSKLGLGSSGYVLQSNGTALVYDYLDGGTF